MAPTEAAVARFEREKAERRQKQRETLELRKAGYSFYKIAQIQGCTPQTAHNRYKKAIKADIPLEEVMEARTLELDRYDEITVMNMKIMAVAYAAGDTETFFKAQNAINAVHDRRKALIPMAVPAKMVIEQDTTLRTSQDRELADLLDRAATDVEEKIKWLVENHDPLGDPLQ